MVEISVDRYRPRHRAGGRANGCSSPSSPPSRTAWASGLSICRTIIEAHGGRLWAEPNPAAARSSASPCRPRNSFALDQGRRRTHTPPSRPAVRQVRNWTSKQPRGRHCRSPTRPRHSRPKRRTGSRISRRRRASTGCSMPRWVVRRSGFRRRVSRSPISIGRCIWRGAGQAAAAREKAVRKTVRFVHLCRRGDGREADARPASSRCRRTSASDGEAWQQWPFNLIYQALPAAAAMVAQRDHRRARRLAPSRAGGRVRRRGSCSTSSRRRTSSPPIPRCCSGHAAARAAGIWCAAR